MRRGTGNGCYYILSQKLLHFALLLHFMLLITFCGVRVTGEFLKQYLTEKQNGYLQSGC